MKQYARKATSLKPFTIVVLITRLAGASCPGLPLKPLPKLHRTVMRIPCIACYACPVSWVHKRVYLGYIPVNPIFMHPGMPCAPTSGAGHIPIFGDGHPSEVAESHLKCERMAKIIYFLLAILHLFIGIITFTFITFTGTWKELWLVPVMAFELVWLFIKLWRLKAKVKNSEAKPAG